MSDADWAEFIEDCSRRGTFQGAMGEEIAKDLTARLSTLLKFPWYVHVADSSDPDAPLTEFDICCPDCPDSFNLWTSFGQEDIIILMNHERVHWDLHKHELKCTIEDPHCLDKLLNQIVVLLRHYEGWLETRILK